MTTRLRRSVLYVPGSNARAREKSRSIPADALVFDLEDSVFPAEKTTTRSAVARVLESGGFGPREIIVRINPLDSEWGRDDLIGLSQAGLDAILLPKVATPGDIMFAAADLAKAGAPDSLRLWAMVETPAAVLNATALARTAADPASRLDVLVMGTNDLATDLRAKTRPGRAALVPWLATCVAAARCHDLDILDGVYNAIDDAAGLRAECEQGRDFGMDGKTCVHPAQVEICNDVFGPDAEELAWARKVVAAFNDAEGASKSVLRIDGQMVERLHVAAAERILALEDAVARRQS
jgi:citrate lyase subunit beta/citryl-CoA lyase